MKKAWKIALAVVLALFLLFSAVSFVFVKLSFDENFQRTAPREFTAYIQYQDVEDWLERELISFPSGENQLQGYLYGADHTKGLIVLSHGMGGGADNYLGDIMYFLDAGYQVFAFDNTGCYLSEGNNCVGPVQSVIDLDAALTFIEGEPRFEGLPVLLYGHSWGGYAVTAIFNFDHEIAASVSVSGFNESMEMTMEWIQDMGVLAKLEYPYIYLYQRMLFGEKLDFTAVRGINRTDTPVLLIHGTEDQVISLTGSATMARRDEITNPNVEYKLCDSERQNGHNNLLYALDALDYMDELNTEYDKLYEEYNEDIPDEVKRAFYDGVDKLRVEARDPEFMRDVLDFYERAIGETEDGNF